MISNLILLLFILPAVAGVILFPENGALKKGAVLKALKNLELPPQKAGLTCFTCHIAIEALQKMIKEEKTDEEIFAFAKTLCINLNLEQPYACNKGVDMFGAEVIFVLQRAVITPEDFCAVLIKDCGHGVNPFDDLWPMEVPEGKPPVKPWPTVPAGKPKMRVLHLSDIHVDRWYDEGSEADCTDGTGLDAYGTYFLCCRNYPPGQQNGGKTRDGAIKVPAGKWGAPWTCDIPYRTFDSAMRHISQTEKNLDYIIITGDFEAHDVWDYTKERTSANLHNITAVITAYFPNIPIYQAIGNHEGVPSDAMPPHSMPDYEKHSPEWLYAALADNWSPNLDAQAISDVKYRASYAIYIKKGLKLISFNSVYCSEINFYLYIDQTDPDFTLQWLSDQLLEAELKGDKVHLISHIPSGESYCLKGWAFNFYKLVNRFENTIAAQFYGHTHYDHFEVYYDNADPNGRPTSFNFISPSLSTYNFLHPSYRVYEIDGEYDGSSYTVIDAETYWTNVTEANVNNHEPVWELEYNTRQAYNMKDLSPASWHELINRLDNDRSLFEKFHFRFYRNHYDEKCLQDQECVNTFICMLKMGRSYDEDNFCKNKK